MIFSQQKLQQNQQFVDISPLNKYSSLRGNITTKKRRKQIYIIQIKIHPLESERAKTTCALNNLNDDRGWLLLSSLSHFICEEG